MCKRDFEANGANVPNSTAKFTDYAKRGPTEARGGPERRGRLESEGEGLKASRTLASRGMEGRSNGLVVKIWSHLSRGFRSKFDTPR